MKIWISSVFIVTTFFAVAQLPEKLKYDRLTYSYDSSTVFIQKGKLNSVYDCINLNYAIEPTQSKIIPFQNSNNYALIELKTNRLWIYLISKSGRTAVAGNEESCFVSFKSPAVNPKFANLNGKKFDLHSMEFTGENEQEIFGWSQFRIERINVGIYLVTSYQTPLNYFNDRDEHMYDKGYTKSGLYDVMSETWLIEPVYKECHFMNGYFLCLNEEWKTDYGFSNDVPDYRIYSRSYDIFQLNEKEVVTIQMRVEKMEPEMLAKIFGVDSVFESKDGLHYVTKKNGLQGLVYFDFERFYFQEILKPEYQWVLFDWYYKMGYTLNQMGDISLWEISINVRNLAWEYYKVEQISSDDQFFEYSVGPHYSPDPVYCNSKGCFKKEATEENTTWVETSYSLASYGRFCISVLNDSLVKVQCYVRQFPPNPIVAIRSVVYPDEDSLDEQGNVVYFRSPSLAYESSGIYNYKKGEWFILPQYYSVVVGGKSYVLSNFYKEDDEFKSGESRFHITDLNGDFISENISESDFLAQPQLLAYAYSGCAADTVFPAPTGYDQHTLKKNNPYLNSSYYAPEELYYMKCENEMGIYYPDHQFENLRTNETFEFVHFNPTTGSYFYLEGDSIYLRAPFVMTAVSRKSGKIIFMQPYENNDEIAPYRLIVIENGDTTFLGEDLQGYESITICSIEMKGDLLIVNDHTTRVNQSCVECAAADGNGLVDYKLEYESESSSVWQKVGDSWCQVSPYYATISALPNRRFVASTGFYEFESYDFYGTPNQPPKIEIEGRYMLLDSNMKVIPYMDYFDFAYIEDLGFGLKVQLNTGDKYFFMTYDGVAITNAEWDDFEKEGKKLKAILNFKYETDPETGEPVLNEYGVPNELVSETVKYFTLP